MLYTIDKKPKGGMKGFNLKILVPHLTAHELNESERQIEYVALMDDESIHVVAQTAGSVLTQHDKDELNKLMENTIVPGHFRRVFFFANKNKIAGYGYICR